MPTVNLKLKKNVDQSYKILIEKGAADKIPAFLKKNKIGEKFAIITDNTVDKLYAQPFKKFLKSKDIEAEIFSFKAGEKAKQLSTIEQLAEAMIKKNFTRKDAIIAFGGGVVGDIAGFLAAIYMRGIPYIQVPTNLLAMVDSSIGGKTGVDLIKGGKNLIGTITQPAAVFMDTKYLTTLPTKQIRNGLGEIIKYGVIKSPGLFKFIEQNMDKILDKDEKALEKIIVESVKIKSKVVESDEKEKAGRMILNYGHTYGHAIEKLSNYTLLHGFAISIGMVIANKMAVEKGLLKKEDAERIKKLFKAAGLPTTTLLKPSKKDLKSDKKFDGTHLNFILPTKIGHTIIHKEKC